jgi:hypothetical protein
MSRKTSALNLAVQRIVNHYGGTVEARGSSASGRWLLLLIEHTREGLGCYDVLAVRSTDLAVTRWEWWAKGEEGTTYDDTRDLAKAKARIFFEQTLAQLQEKAQPQESEEDKGLRILNPDGTEQDYELN